MRYPAAPPTRITASAAQAGFETADDFLTLTSLLLVTHVPQGRADEQQTFPGCVSEHRGACVSEQRVTRRA
jgi:hypothetical protein